MSELHTILYPIPATLLWIQLPAIASGWEAADGTSTTITASQVGDLNGETEDLSFCVSLSLPVTLHCKQVNLLKSYIKNIPAFPCDVSYVKISSASCVIGSLHLDSSIPAWASPHC